MPRNESESGAGAATLVGADMNGPTKWEGADAAAISSAESLDRLDRLDPHLLRKRWRTVMGRAAPASLSRQLMIRILSWREQVARLGDLDPKSLAALAAALNGKNGSEHSSSVAAPPRGPRPGAVLVREHGGVLHRVMALERGYAWNGRTFGSLSSVARAISGTNWNGRRFFSLDRIDDAAKDASKTNVSRRTRYGGSS